MKGLTLRKDARLVPARDKVLVFTDNGSASLEGENITSLVGRLAPLVLHAAPRDRIIENFPTNERRSVAETIESLSRQGILLEVEIGERNANQNNPGSLAPSITFVGHATLLIETSGLRILTDPWMFARDKHIDRSPYPITFEDLPPLDLICISHRHGDHMNLPTLMRLPKTVPVIVPRIENPTVHNRSLDRTVLGLGFQEVISLRVWESFTLKDVTITRTPCHLAWSIMEQATWLIESPEMTLFCGGDMMEDEQFMKRLGENYNVDIAFLPISGYSARIGESGLKDLMPATKHDQIIRDVMGIKEAAQATKWINPKFAVGYANGGAYWYKHPECSITSGTVEEFVRLLKQENPLVQAIDMIPGDVWEHNAKQLHRR
jgi:L-ascorbate metabolism protein UlaG (beta-lactamase superfamily)